MGFGYMNNLSMFIQFSKEVNGRVRTQSQSGFKTYPFPGTLLVIDVFE